MAASHVNGPNTPAKKHAVGCLDSETRANGLLSPRNTLQQKSKDRGFI